MKRFLLVILVAVLLIIIGCNGNSNNTNSCFQGDKSDVIIWSQAISHVGERTTVLGPVMSVTYASTVSGKPTFINIGKNYPQNGRFTALIWGDNRSQFSPAPEIQYEGETIYVYGLIQLYQGNAEIIVSSPCQIAIK